MEGQYINIVFKKRLLLFCKYSVISLCSLFILTNASAQQNKYEIFGLVIDKYTKEPLAGANVIENNPVFNGVPSEVDGIFTITVDDLPTSIQIRYLGYEDYTLEIGDSLQEEYIVEMIPAITNLPGPTVTAEVKVDTIFKEAYSVVDYEFHNNHIFLLAYKNAIEKYSLIALGPNDKIFNILSLEDRRPVELFKSCSGDLYVITEVNGHRIELTEYGVRLREQIPIPEFDEYLNPCTVSTKDYVVFSKYFYQGQAMEYNIFKENGNGQKSRIAFIEDGPNIERLFEDAGVKKPWSGDNWEENTTEEIESLREGGYVVEGMMKIFYPKLYAPIFRKDNGFILFNHQDKRIDCMSVDGHVHSTVNITYPDNKKWRKQIYYDEKNEEAYTSFHTRWGEEICPINLDTGTIGKGILLNMAFIEKVKAWNGYLYFLYKDQFRGEHNNRLFKLPLNTH